MQSNYRNAPSRALIVVVDTIARPLFWLLHRRP